MLHEDRDVVLTKYNPTTVVRLQFNVKICDKEETKGGPKHQHRNLSITRTVITWQKNACSWKIPLEKIVFWPLG